MSHAQPIWNPQHQRYLHVVWDDNYKQRYWKHYVEGQGWVFFEWIPEQPPPPPPPPHMTPAHTNQSEFEEVRNPRNFFKIGRVFITSWTEPDGRTGQPHTKDARFAVVKPGAGFSVCLRISTYSGQATTKPGVIPYQHAAVVEQGHPPAWIDGEDFPKLLPPIEIKIEGQGVDVSPASRINFAKPYTIEHNIKVRNVGRVVGESTSVSQIVPVSLVASLSFDLKMPPASNPGFEGQTLSPSARS
ncbi:unnamed protein product [Alternaria alternata]